MIYLEGGSEISAGSRHHRQYGQVFPEEVEIPRAHSILRHDVEASVAVQGIIDFMKIYEYIIQDLLPQIHELLEKIGFQGGGLGASACTEAMQVVVKLNSSREAEIQDPYHVLPEDINHTNVT